MDLEIQKRLLEQSVVKRDCEDGSTHIAGDKSLPRFQS